MDRLRHNLIIVLSFAVVGCGPGRVGSGQIDSGSDSGSESTSSSETSTSTSSTDSSDTETSDTQTSAETWTTVDFIPRTDDWLIEDCDPFAQDCPEGEKCVPYASTGGSWDANKCVPILGDGMPGEPCTWGGVVEATDDCDASGICWDVMEVDGELVGTCTAFCTGTADAPECPPGASCILNGDSTINLCIFICDPLLQDCQRGFACYWDGGDFGCSSTSENIPTGEPCEFFNDCAIGHVCVAAETLPSCASPQCCTLFCDIELGDQQCEAMPGTSCVPLFEQGQAPPGYELVGLCTLPG